MSMHVCMYSSTCASSQKIRSTPFRLYKMRAALCSLLSCTFTPKVIQVKKLEFKTLWYNFNIPHDCTKRTKENQSQTILSVLSLEEIF